MNILYLTQINIDLEINGIYSDLINELISLGHKVTLICADNCYKKNEYIRTNKLNKLQIKVGDQFGVNNLKKGVILLSLEYKIKKAIKTYLNKDKFDLILYATPPITFSNVVRYCKQKYNCVAYLMLKDIFPQNAIDIGIMKKIGISGILYRYFRKKEKDLYNISDKIGCMSKANLDYMLNNNNVNKEKLELFPNSIKIKPISADSDKSTLKKFGINDNKITFVYGGNLGRPQGLDYLVKGINACKDIDNIHFIIVGKGSEQKRIFKQLESNKNVTTLEYMSKPEYNKLCQECDVGLILLDYRFTIPNYPSRILEYMENAKPVFACTDKASDIKDLVENEARCGKWVFSKDPQSFVSGCKWFLMNKDKFSEMGYNGRKYLEKNFNIDDYILKIISLVKERNKD